MHARILTYVDEVARQGSIRAAAERLNVAASAISRQIIALEDELGTPLFSRGARRLTLTSAGELLVRHIRETFKEMDRTRMLIEDLKGLRRGEVTLAMMSGLASNIVPRAVTKFRAENPRVTVKLRLMSTGERILGAVANKDADLGIGFDFAERPHLRVQSAAMVRLGAVMAPSHPLAERPVLRLSDCLAHTMVLADASMVIRPYLDHLLERAEGAVTDVIETNSIEMMRHLVRTSAAITFLTPFDIEYELQEGNLVYVPVQELAARTQSLSLVAPARAGNALASVLMERLDAEIREALARTGAGDAGSVQRQRAARSLPPLPVR